MGFWQGFRRFSAFDFRGSGVSPGEDHQTQALPAEIWRKDQEPGDDVAMYHLGTKSSEKIAIPNTAVGAKNDLADLVNNHWHNDQSQE